MSSIFDGLASTFVAVIGDDDLFTYTTKAGSTAEAKGVLEEPTRIEGLPGSAPEIEVAAVISFAVADLPGGIGQGDTIQHGARSWTTRAPLPDGHGMVRFELEKIA